LVYKRPLIAIISTGNELVEPSRKPGISQIRNSNSYQIMAQTLQMGLSYEYLGIVADSELSLIDHLSEAVKKYDVVIISGGVSVGDYDFVPKVLQNLGIETLFHGLKAKPGKHILFGRKENHYVIGLPGNPVSSFVQFYVLVKPLLQMLMGQTPRTGILYMPIAEDYNREKDDILAFIPVEITENGNARPLEYHGSAHIQAYTKANGIMEMPIGISEYIKGDIVRVRPI
jgi:molybdopterin molybdotransferase